MAASLRNSFLLLLVRIALCNGALTRQEVEDAQLAWGNGIVSISATYNAGGDYTQAARDHINQFYSYGISDVLFKPTLATNPQFRPTFDDALSYFVGNGIHAEDNGFAILGWTNVRWLNEDIILYGDTAMAMGNYWFTNPAGVEQKVEYTFGYFKHTDGTVRINLHHSSFPFIIPMTLQQVEAAQLAWGNGIVGISATYAAGGNYTQAAIDHINQFYSYGISDVLFKPTLATDPQFRPTYDGALSYFVGNGIYAEDNGFAILGWTNVRWQNDNVIIHGDTAMAMGNYWFTNPAGVEQKVEYTFGYFLHTDGTVRINLHHSSFPYVIPAAATTPETDPDETTSGAYRPRQGAAQLFCVLSMLSVATLGSYAGML